VNRYGRRGAINPWLVILISAVLLAVMFGQRWIPGALGARWEEFWGFRPLSIVEQWQQLGGGGSGWGLLKLISALFAHSSWLHLFGNLAYLWVFGIPVERAVGHVRFALIFLLLGALANLLVAFQLPDMDRIVLGASGGVSAIIGVFLGLFPRRQIGLWLPLGVYPQFARIPALLVIGSWFTLQLLYTVFGPVADAVAWWTHTAGFVAGVLAAILVRPFLGRYDSRVD